MTAMNLVSFTEQSKSDLKTLHPAPKQGKEIADFIFKTLSRRNKPMDEYEDTYRIQADFFCCIYLNTGIYFEREKNGTVIISRIIQR